MQINHWILLRNKFCLRLCVVFESDCNVFQAFNIPAWCFFLLLYSFCLSEVEEIICTLTLASRISHYAKVMGLSPIFSTE